VTCRLGNLQRRRYAEGVLNKIEWIIYPEKLKRKSLISVWDGWERGDDMNLSPKFKIRREGCKRS
jgi:hypothetical protein